MSRYVRYDGPAVQLESKRVSELARQADEQRAALVEKLNYLIHHCCAETSDETVRLLRQRIERAGWPLVQKMRRYRDELNQYSELLNQVDCGMASADQLNASRSR